MRLTPDEALLLWLSGRSTSAIAAETGRSADEIEEGLRRLVSSRLRAASSREQLMAESSLSSDQIIQLRDLWDRCDRLRTGPGVIATPRERSAFMAVADAILDSGTPITDLSLALGISTRILLRRMQRPDKRSTGPGSS